MVFLRQCLTLSCKSVQVVIYAPNVQTLAFDNCTSLESVLIWSESLTSLAFPGCVALKHLDIRCPNVTKLDHPPLVKDDQASQQGQPQLRDIVTEKRRLALEQERARRCASLSSGSTQMLVYNPECGPARSAVPLALTLHRTLWHVQSNHPLSSTPNSFSCKLRFVH